MIDRALWPLWVRVGLWSIHRRGVAVGYALFALGGAVVCALLIPKDPRFAAGLVLLGAAAWYWAALRWVDRHGTWR